MNPGPPAEPAPHSARYAAVMALPPRTDLSDDEPPGAGVDPPLSLQARTPGVSGLWPKLALAALALIILIAIVVGFLIVSRVSHRESPAADQAIGAAALPTGRPRR